jgi:hypothetical protein
MRIQLTLMVLAAAAVARADDLEPAVNTSSAPPAPAASATTPAPLGATPAPPSVRAAAAATAPARRPAAAKARAADQIDLDTTQITGNRELPNVMYVVPWKKADLGDFAGRPPKSLLDELLAPVDRDVFRRQNRYFAALHPDAAAVPAPPAPAAPAGATTTLPAGDEK